MTVVGWFGCVDRVGRRDGGGKDIHVSFVPFKCVCVYVVMCTHCLHELCFIHSQIIPEFCLGIIY